MMMKTFERRILLILVSLAAVFSLVILVGSLVGLPSPVLTAQRAAAGQAGEDLYQVGARGSLTLTFPSPVDPESFETHISMSPSAAGKFLWNGESRQSVSFQPSEPLKPSQHYLVHLAAGLKGQNGLTLRHSVSWEVEVREEEILYLAPSQAPELWMVSADGQNRIQLSSSEGNVYDFGVSPDGEKIVFSVKNEQQGMDLWEVDRSGKPAKLLLPCGADWCFHPALAPDGTKLVYSRGRASGLQEGAAGAPNLWQLDLDDHKTNVLFSDANIGGEDAEWSPDGRFLAFMDKVSAGLRVLDFDSKKDYLVESGAETAFTWSPDSQALLYTLSTDQEDQPSILIYRWDAQTQHSTHLLGDEDSQPVDYSAPGMTSDGKWLVVARRLMAGPAGKQLWLFRSDGSQREPITDDVLSSYGGCHWNLDGTRLVFQRLALGTSDSTPQLMTWNRLDQKMVVVVEDAFQPAWIP